MLKIFAFFEKEMPEFTAPAFQEKFDSLDRPKLQIPSLYYKFFRNSLLEITLVRVIIILQVLVFPANPF
jgi:hypothetical protein